ncbi:hypothetical protein C8R46DRAFT_475096 [Mycena filopes]|nr:hypothetical protein C8R46DRAFT_475096 [Mycena filopes]
MRVPSLKKMTSSFASRTSCHSTGNRGSTRRLSSMRWVPQHSAGSGRTTHDDDTQWFPRSTADRRPSRRAARLSKNSAATYPRPRTQCSSMPLLRSEKNRRIVEQRHDLVTRIWRRLHLRHCEVAPDDKHLINLPVHCQQADVTAANWTNNAGIHPRPTSLAMSALAALQERSPSTTTRAVGRHRSDELDARPLRNNAATYPRNPSPSTNDNCKDSLRRRARVPSGAHRSTGLDASQEKRSYISSQPDSVHLRHPKDGLRRRPRAPSGG